MNNSNVNLMFKSYQQFCFRSFDCFTYLQQLLIDTLQKFHIKSMEQKEFQNGQVFKQSQFVLINHPIRHSSINQHLKKLKETTKEIIIRSLQSFFSLLVILFQQKQHYYYVQSLSIDRRSFIYKFNVTIKYQDQSQRIVAQLLGQATHFEQLNEPIWQQQSLQSVCLRIFFNDNVHTLLELGGDGDDLEIDGQIILENILRIRKLSQRTFILTKLQLNYIKSIDDSQYFFLSRLIFLKSNQIFINLCHSSSCLDTANSSSLLELYGLDKLQIQSSFLQARYSYIIEYHLQVKFKDEEKMISYLLRNYAKYSNLINFQQSKNALVRNYNINQFSNLHRQLTSRLYNINKKLHLVVEQEKQYTQSMSFQPPSVNRYDSISRILTKSDILAIQPCIEYVEAQLMQLHENRETCNYQLEKYYKIINIIKQIIKSFEIKKQNNGQKDKDQNIQRVKENKEPKDNKAQIIFSVFQHLYPNITHIIQSFFKKTSFQQKKEQYPNQLNSILISYIKNLMSQENKQTSAIYVKVNNPLKQLSIDWVKYLIQSSKRWIDVFNCLTLSITKSTISPQKYNGTQSPQYLMYPDTSCLGCTKFFYSNTGNLINPKNTVNIKLFPFVEKISQYENQIVEVICKFLNNDGGIILFNCMKSYTKITASGCLLTQKNKQAIQNKLYSFLQRIYPKPQVVKNINLSFVPVAIFPKSNKQPDMQDYKGQIQLKSQQKHIINKYIQGVYVARIKVVPTNRSKVYIFDNGVKWFLPNMTYISMSQKGNIKIEAEQKITNGNFKEYQYSIKHLYRAIKRNQNRFAVQSKSMFLPKIAINPLSHECVPPQGGIKIQGKSIQPKKNQLQQNSHPEPYYPHTSLIVCKQAFLPILNEKLLSLGIKCEIRKYFDGNRPLKLKAANHTAVLFHECRFDDLLYALHSNSQLRFEGRALIAIYVTKYLKFQGYINLSNTNSELIRAHTWLKNLFPGQQMKFYRYRAQNNKEQFYLQTGSRLSTLFMYLLFNSYGIKAGLRNPLHLDKQTQHERNKRFKLVDIFFQNKQESQTFWIDEGEEVE